MNMIRFSRIPTIVGLCAGLFMTQADAACPLKLLGSLIDEPTKSLKVRDIEASKAQSTEGGVWKVFFRPSGKVHSIQRTDFGETGRTEHLLALNDKSSFAIRVVVMGYKEPNSPTNRTTIAERSSVDYFFCGDTAYVPMQANAPDRGAQAVVDANVARQVFFGAKEISQFLR